VRQPDQNVLEIHSIDRSDRAGAGVIVRCHRTTLRTGTTVHLVDADHTIVSGSLTVRTIWRYSGVAVLRRGGTPA
jgi:hypothetical protein